MPVCPQRYWEGGLAQVLCDLCLFLCWGWGGVCHLTHSRTCLPSGPSFCKLALACPRPSLPPPLERRTESDRWVWNGRQAGTAASCPSSLGSQALIGPTPPALPLRDWLCGSGSHRTRPWWWPSSARRARFWGSVLGTALAGPPVYDAKVTSVSHLAALTCFPMAAELRLEKGKAFICPATPSSSCHL